MKTIKILGILCSLLFTIACKKETKLENDSLKVTKLEAAFTSTGKFYTTGNKIIDPNGNQFVAKGANVNGYRWVWPGSTVGYFDLIVNKWKFNLIRVPNVWDYRPHDFTEYSDNNDIDAIVNKYTAAKVVVLLDDHVVGGLNTSSTQSSAVAKFKELATKYKNNPYVWFEVHNEPEGDINTWNTQAIQILDGIRSTGAQNIVVIPGVAWGQDTGKDWTCTTVPDSKSFILSKGPAIVSSKTNVVFDFHAYDQWTQCETKFKNFLDRTISLNLPIIIGEYGVDNNGDTSPATTYLFNTAPSRNISRVVWCWWGGDNNNLTTSGNGGGQNTTFDGSGKPTNLTWLGQKVWNDTHSTTTPPPTSGGTYEAESATLSGPVVATSWSGYTGSGYLDFPGSYGSNVYAQWGSVNVSTAGTYTLVFRYTNGSGSNRPLQLTVNGSVKNSSLAFNGTSTWGTWNTVTVSNISLNAGNNTIRLTALNNVGPDIDNLKVQ